MVETSSYAGEVRGSLRGIDTDRFVKSSPGGLLLFANGNVDVEARFLNDNSIVVDHVNSINSFADGLAFIGFLESNREALDLNSWLSPPHIPGGLHISHNMTNLATQTELLMLLARNTPIG